MENAERALQHVAVLDRDGKPTGEYRYDGNVANRALELLGKPQGMFIDRHEVGQPNQFANWTDDELESFIKSGTKPLGIVSGKTQHWCGLDVIGEQIERGKADMKTEITLNRQTNTAERAAITLEGLIEKASQILDLAIAEKQFNAAVAALREIETLAGLRIERREVRRPGEFELLSADLRH